MRIGCLGMILLALALALAGCSSRSGSDHAETELSERQRDSVLARSDLPGAHTIGRAMAESDRAAHRAAAYDTLGR